MIESKFRTVNDLRQHSGVHLDSPSGDTEAIKIAQVQLHRQNQTYFQSQNHLNSGKYSKALIKSGTGCIQVFFRFM